MSLTEAVTSGALLAGSLIPKMIKALVDIWSRAPTLTAAQVREQAAQVMVDVLDDEAAEDALWLELKRRRGSSSR